MKLSLKKLQAAITEWEGIVADSPMNCTDRAVLTALEVIRDCQKPKRKWPRVKCQMPNSKCQAPRKGPTPWKLRVECWALLVHGILVLSAGSASAATIALEWDANTDRTTGYSIYGTVNGVTSELVTVAGINTTTATVNVPCGEWEFHCRANYEAEQSGPSNTVAVKSLAAPAVLIPLPVVSYAGGVLYNAACSWTPSAPEYGVTNYVAALTKANGTVDTFNTGTNRTAFFTGLTEGNHTLRVTPQNRCGNGAIAFVNFAITRLGQPKNFRTKQLL